ncbi:MAG: ABC-type transport auxiliary lipoprotein family protein [Polyangiaceae bacterium]
MTPTHSLRTAFLGIAIGVTGMSYGCALSTKADLVPIRYFSPEQLAPTTSTLPPLTAHELKLGRITSGPNLRERIAYRQTRYELGYYDDLRWTERPETYVRRAMGRALFESGRFRRAIHGPAPTLDIEVLSFDDLRLDDRRAARVALRYVLQDDTGVRIERTASEETQVRGAEPRIEQVVEAMAFSLDRAIQKIVVAVDEWFAGTIAAQSQFRTQSIDEQTERSQGDESSPRAPIGVTNDGSTEQGAPLRMSSAVLPNVLRLDSDRPCVPTTTSSALRSEAKRITDSAGLPHNT